MKQSIRNLWKWLLETVFVLALVLISFLTLLAALNLFFPSGQNLFRLIQGTDGGSSSFHSRITDNRHLSVGVAERESDIGDLTTMRATLTRMTNDVKSRRSSEIAWKNAAPGMTLYDHDAVQTGRRSTARLFFGRKSYLDMDENSLLIVRSLERDIFLKSARTVAVLVEGQFAGEIQKSEKGPLDIDLVTPGAVARLPSPQDAEHQTSFKMVVNSDESSILTMYQGKADLLYQGRTLEVGSNQIVKMKPGRKPVFLPPPPPPPEIVLPADGESIAYRDTPPKVSFVWKGSKNALRYRFVLARDDRFEDIVYEKVTNRTIFIHGNLKAGQYYWHVSCIGPEEEGGYSKSYRLSMIQDLKPPALEVNLPEGPYVNDTFVLKGRTEPKAQLFVNGKSAVVDKQGGFEVGVDLKRGWNVLVLEAVDQVGNVAYFSSTLNVQDQVLKIPN